MVSSDFHSKVGAHPLQPTAKFYSKDGKRSVEVLMGETAYLPLRLTGDGVGLLLE